MSDIVKKAFENIDPEAEKRLDEKLKNGSELFGLYDVSNGEAIKLYETCIDGKINMCKCKSDQDCKDEAKRRFNDC